ncbi:hypothetical protein EFN43_02190 [Pediococcus pentosaceus]|jgi:DNA repair protein RadC|uniref:JAB domain-containing protein n=1 Tax=Pediococcus pentosaceus TaxID=1255 RepID=UPI0021A58A2F|nr:JAB domain-containing protein [Pediococcus pentosaceus]MCT3019896.1 hypothetical protein [Pediococcus pentosaceus]
MENILKMGHVRIDITQTKEKRFKVRRVSQCAEKFCNDIGDYGQEVLKLLYLNTKSEVVFEQELFHGTINSAQISPFQIIQTAVINNTTKIAIAHNHPSGNVEPSENDIYFGQQVKKALAICGIDLIDFFVVSSDDYTSFAEKNLF